MKSNPKIPTTAEIKQALEVLSIMAGTDTEFPYTPTCEKEAKRCAKELQDILKFREEFTFRSE